MEALQSTETSGTDYPAMQRHILGERARQYRYGTLRNRNPKTDVDSETSVNPIVQWLRLALSGHNAPLRKRVQPHVYMDDVASLLELNTSLLHAVRN